MLTFTKLAITLAVASAATMPATSDLSHEVEEHLEQIHDFDNEDAPGFNPDSIKELQNAMMGLATKLGLHEGDPEDMSEEDQENMMNKLNSALSNPEHSEAIHNHFDELMNDPRYKGIFDELSGLFHDEM